jgi:hypothetical protein
MSLCHLRILPICGSLPRFPAIDKPVLEVRGQRAALTQGGLRIILAEHRREIEKCLAILE